MNVGHRNWWAYLQEIRTYCRVIGRPQGKQTKKFVVFCRGRSGSNLLVSLLNNCPEVHCDYELLFSRRLFPGFFIRARVLLARSNVYGFKLLSAHLRPNRQPIGNPSDFLRKLDGSGFQFIYLIRENVLRTALSEIYAYKRQIWHHYSDRENPEVVPIQIKGEELVRTLKQCEEDHAFEHELLTEIPHLRIRYETDLENSDAQARTLQRVAEFLNIAPGTPSTPFVRVTPQTVSDFVSNLASLRAELTGSPYEKYLSPDFLE
jgi:LPS sulfotransferase NodH